MELFTDRERGAKPRTTTVIDRRLESAIAALIQGFSTREAFGIDFPSACPDGGGFDGMDVRSFQAAMYGVVPEMEGWLDRAIVGSPKKPSFPSWSTEDEPEEAPIAETGVILDTLEWLAAHIGEPIQGVWHDFFRHHHLTWDRDVGRALFCQAVNSLFMRNGIAYTMDESGQFQRVIEGATPEILARANFSTGDNSTDQLLEVARRRFFDRDPDAGQRSIEALWDAFERIKTLADPSDKKKSVSMLISRVAKSPNADTLIDEEMRALTQIGNNWRIRHHEVGKTELGNDPELRDYLFLRMFDLIRLLLQHQK